MFGVVSLNLEYFLDKDIFKTKNVWVDLIDFDYECQKVIFEERVMTPSPTINLFKTKIKQENAISSANYYFEQDSISK